MPEPISVVEGERFGLSSMRIIDLFPESPGPEIVAVHGHPLHSPNLLRICDLSGRVLYQVWHDGLIGRWVWLARHRLMVCTGLNSENDWRGRGFPGVRQAIYPLVVFALRPEAGAVHDAWIRTPGGRGTVEPVWYKAIQPPEAVDALHAALVGMHQWLEVSPMVTSDEADDFITGIGVDPHRLNFVVDAAGRVTRRECTLSYEDLRRSVPALPPIEALNLVELPPLLVDPRRPPR